MPVKRYVLVSAALLAVGAGAGAAIAATSGSDKQTEQSILNDAAQRLNVSPDALRSALSAAENAQLDQAVKNGQLTQQQADAIKQRRQQDGSVLDFHGGRGAGHGGFGFGPGRGSALSAAATALGLDRAQLVAKLRSGQSIADVAKAQSKSLDDVKSAIKDAVTKDLDAAVTAGRITDAERQQELTELDQHLDDLVNATPGSVGHGFLRGARPGRHWR